MEYPERKTFYTNFGYCFRVDSLRPIGQTTQDIIMDVVKAEFISQAKSAGLPFHIVYNFRESQSLTQDDSVARIEIWEDRKYLVTIPDLAENRQAVIDEYEQRTGNKVR